MKPNFPGIGSGSVNRTRIIRNPVRFGTKGTRISGSVRCSAELFGFVCTLARTELNSDNMPTVLAARKLQRGEFSRSVRITYFLSALAAFPVDVVYRKGDGHPGDYDSRHTIACDEKKCQVCEFAFDLAGPTSLESMFKDDTMTQINNVTADDIISGRVSVPFTTSLSEIIGWNWGKL